jgi:hypothetical protein
MDRWFSAYFKCITRVWLRDQSLLVISQVEILKQYSLKSRCHKDDVCKRSEILSLLIHLQFWNLDWILTNENSTSPFCCLCSCFEFHPYDIINADADLRRPFYHGSTISYKSKVSLSYLFDFWFDLYSMYFHLWGCLEFCGYFCLLDPCRSI